MRVLILGATGMLGHKLYQVLQDQFETWAAIRSGPSSVARYGFYEPQQVIGGIDAFNFDTIIRALAIARPDVVVNCIGIIKQLDAAHDAITSLTINSLLPHRLAALCQASGARLIHISTDCVFSGRRGLYKEEDVPDATDLYGRSKLMGEVAEPNCLTLRTSIIGRELRTANGLLEWFLNNQEPTVRGYSRAIFSGLTTTVLSQQIANVIENHPQLAGVYQISAEPINKYDLLCLVREHFDRQAEIIPYSDVQIDRSLDSSRFRGATGFNPPSWAMMIQEIAADTTPYESWRKDEATA